MGDKTASEERLCIRRLRSLGADIRLSPKERDDIRRAIQAVQYTRVTKGHHRAVAELFEPDRAPAIIWAADSIDEARSLILFAGGYDPTCDD